MGAVVRSTALLAAIKRQHPSMHLTWVTQAPMHHLLRSHRLIDRVLTTSIDDQLTLGALEFDIAYVIDKSLVAAGLLKLTQADQVYGFVSDPATGAILPATSAGEKLWQLGLDDHQKFFVNQKTENELVHEALELGPYQKDDYQLELLALEKFESLRRHELWTLRKDQPVIGFNTGCGPLMPAKKWTPEFHRQVIQKFLDLGFKNLVLLGGPEDQARNQEIGAGLPVIQSATNEGIRDGLISIDACDIVISGDSFGLHLGIAMKKFMIAWFGPSCAHEIELYGRGVKLLTEAPCSPCWKRHCAQSRMCYDQIQPESVVQALDQGINWWKTSQKCSRPSSEDQKHI
jgi:heptosyltransferase-2